MTKNQSPYRFWKFSLRAIWVLYFLALFTATHIPVPTPFVDVVSLFDKVIHASAFFVLGVLTILAWCWEPPLRKPSFWFLYALLGYAALDEYLQGFVNRTPDPEDWFSDAFGITLAFLLMRFLATRKTSEHPDISEAASAETLDPMAD